MALLCAVPGLSLPTLLPAAFLTMSWHMSGFTGGVGGCFVLVIMWLSSGWLLKLVHPIPDVSANVMACLNASCFQIDGKCPCVNKSMGGV